MDQMTLNASPDDHNLGEITLRSVLLGIIASVLMVIWLPMAEYLIGASRMNLSQLPVAAFGLFFGVVLVNAAVGRISKGAMLSPTEVLVVFVMAFIGSVMATSDLLGWVFAVDAVPYYLATPENRWMTDLWPYLKQWAVVQGPSEQLRWAFVGMPSGASIPWRIWLVPSFWWASFIGAVAFGSICLASIFRRQWADHERLAFPLAQVPLDIMSNPGGKSSLPAMVRTRAFWIGAAIPLFIILWNIVGYFETRWPRLPIMDETAISMGPGYPENIAIKLNMYVIGFAYMVNTNVLFSVWFWRLIVFFERTVFTRVGYTLGAADDLYSSADAITSWQGFGAFIIFVLWSLWMARRHLLTVARHSLASLRLSRLRESEPPHDEHELLPYRWAVPGLIAATLYMGAFLMMLGMSFTMVCVYLFGAFVAFVGTTRVIAQTGLVYMQSPLTPTMFAFGSFGTLGIPAQEVIGMVGTYSLVVNGRAPLMPAIFHISWLGAKIGKSGRKMFVAVAVGLIVAYLIGTLYMIYISYMHGTTTFLSWAYHQHGEQVYDAVVKKIQARQGVDSGRWMFLGIGALVMAILTFVQYRIPSWPIHPIGFPIAAANNVRMMFFSVFLAWIIKSILLRIGGVEAYERAKPVFLGVVAGYALGVMISFFVDWVWFPGSGHQIHSW